MSRQRRFAALLAVLAAGTAAVGSGGGPHPARADATCRITGGTATLLVREPAPGAEKVFEGAMFVVTRDCGDGPLNVSGSFVPVAGSPASCSPSPSNFQTAYTNANRAACTFSASAGVALPGTPVTVTATAEVVGLLKNNDWYARRDPGDADETEVDPASERVTSVCVMTVPEVHGRQTCTLF